MATAASGNAGVGTIKVVTGDVKVIGVDGVARQAQVGDKVFARETIQTNANAIVQVQLEDGRMLDLGRDSKISLDNDVLGTQGPATTQAPATGDIAALQAQIAAGADPSKVAEATAAGGAPGAGGGGDGSGGTPVVIDQADGRGPVTSGFNTSPASIAFSTAQDPQFINRPPTIEGKHVSVSEEGLNGGNLDENGNGDTTDDSTISGTLNINDVDGQPLTVKLSVPVDPMKSDGETIVWTLSTNGHTLTGTIDGGSTTIITVNVDDLGHYQVTLLGPIDHPDTSGEDDLDFSIPVTVTDPFGASATANLVVTIEDDSPTLAGCECEPILLYANDFNAQGGLEGAMDGATGTLADGWQLFERGDTYNGDPATIVNGKLRLTDESGDDMNWLKVDSGTAFEGSFTAKFDLNITDTVSEGGEGQTFSTNGRADGFSFQVSNNVDLDNPAEEPQSSGFALTIDTFDNGDEPTPTIEVWFDGNLLDSFPNVPANLIYGGPLHVSVDILGEAYTVTITNDSGPVWSASGNMGGALPADADFFFGARTGGNADIHEIDNVVITAVCDAHVEGGGEGGQGGNTPNTENTPFTMASPTGFELPSGATPVGGIVVDLIGLNGVRVVTQLAASSLYVGFSDDGTPVEFRGNPLTIGVQSGFSPELLAQLGGGIDKVAVRFTLYDGDSAPGNFDDGVDNTLLLNGVGLGLWSNVNSLTTDGLGNPIGGVGTGFENNTLDTGWFYSDNPAALADLFAALQGSNQLVVQLDDIDPQDNFFDFTQGVDGSLINVGAGPAVVGENCVTTITAEVREDGMRIATGDLSDGNQTVVNTDADEAVSATGSLRQLYSFGADGPGDFVMLTNTSNLPELFSKGDEVSYSVSGNVLTATAGEDARVVFTLTLDADGSWSFDLQDQLDHVDNDLNDENTALRDGEGSVNSLDFSSLIQVTDGDGDKAPALPEGTFAITVVDDIPVLANVEPLTLTVDEDDIDTPWSQGTSPEDGNADGSFTESNPGPVDPAIVTGSLASLVSVGADETVTFGFTADALAYMQSLGLFSKQTALPENGESLTYAISTDGVWSVLTATEPDTVGPNTNSNPVFELRVNTETGAFEFRLFDELIHAAPESGADENFDLRSGNDGATIPGLNFGAIIEATDADGDAVTLGEAFTINVRDDIPQVDVDIRRNSNGVLHDESPGTQDDDTNSSSVANRFNSVTNRGNDPDVSGSVIGYANSGSAVVSTSDTELGADTPPLATTFSLKVLVANSGLEVTDGSDIMMAVEGSLIVGRVAGGAFDGQAAFAISVDNNGEIYVAQYLSIKHPNTGSSDEEVHINNGAIAIEYSVTDSDGDTVTDQVVMGDLVRFDDDGPSVGSNDTVVLEDDDLPSGIEGGTGDDVAPQNASGTLDHDYGSDGAGSVKLLLANLPSGFTQALSVDGLTLTITQGATDVLRVTLSNSTNGNYTVTQLAPIHHPTDNNENNVNFTLNYRVADGDGDTANGSMQLTVDDDMPSPNMALQQGPLVIHDETSGVDAGSNDTATDLSALFAAVTNKGNDPDVNNALDPAIGYAQSAGAVVNVTPNYGADGAGSTVFSIDIPSGSSASSGLFTTEGRPITLFEVNDTLVVGRYDVAGGSISSSDPAAFAIRIDPATGQMTVVQYVSLRHDDRGDPDESNDNGSNTNDASPNDTPDPVQQAIATGALRVTVEVTDSDGDTVSQQFNIGNKVIFEDDGPSVSSNTTVQLDDDAKINGIPNGIGDDPDSVAAAGTLGHSFGADGAGSIAYLTSGAPAGFSYVASGNDLLVKQGAVTVLTLTLNSTTGAYTVVQNAPIHHLAGDDENNQAFTIGYSVTDGDGDTVNGSLSINVDDDTPAQPAAINKEISEGGSSSTNTNVMLILDVSGSMAFEGNLGLNTLKSSVMALLDAYDALGDVKVRLVTFSSSASQQGGAWLDIGDTSTPGTAKYIVNNLTADGGTDFDDALVAAMSAYASAGKIAGAQSVSYFLSDGNPDPAPGGIDNGEETAWVSFLNNNDVKSYALGMGTNVNENGLDPIAYDGIAGSNMDAVLVDDLGDLTNVLVGTTGGSNNVEGNLTTEGSLTGVFGADGQGSATLIASITHNSVTYTSSGSFTTAAGGTFEFNLATGVYKYTAPANVNNDTPEVFTYTIVDGDGDQKSANLTITVLDGAPVAVADTYAAAESFLVQAASVTEGMSINVPASWSAGTSTTNVSGSWNADPSFSSPSLPDTQDTATFALSADGAHLASVTVNIDPNGRGTGDTITVQLLTSANAVVQSVNYSSSSSGDVTFSGINIGGTYKVRVIADDNGSSGGFDVDIGNLRFSSYTLTPAHTDTYDATAPNVSWSVVPVVGNVLTNDEAEADGVKVVTLVDGTPVAGATIIDGDYGTLSIDSTGAFTYTPDSTDFSGSFPKVDTFSYTMRDGSSPEDTSTAVLTFNLADHSYNASTSNGNTFLGGNDGNNSINGDSSNEVVYGGAGNDILNSDGGNDRVMGGIGNDTLIGGGGNDILVGGSGADTFKWGNGDVGGSVEVDVVMDFTENAGDKLDLTDLLSGEHANAGSLTSYLSFSSNGTDTLLSIKDTGSGSVDQQIVLKGVDLTAGGAHNDSQIITDLLAAGKLITSA